VSSVQWGDVGTWAGVSAAISGIISTGGWKLIKTTIERAIQGYMDNAKIAQTLAAHDTALALLIQAVMPPGQPSLRDILQSIQVETARAAGAASTNTTVVTPHP